MLTSPEQNHTKQDHGRQRAQSHNSEASETSWKSINHSQIESHATKCFFPPRSSAHLLEMQRTNLSEEAARKPSTDFLEKSQGAPPPRCTSRKNTEDPPSSDPAIHTSPNQQNKWMPYDTMKRRVAKALVARKGRRHVGQKRRKMSTGHGRT